MESIDQFVFFTGLILTLSVIAGAISNRGSIPILLIFLGIGMLFGEDGPGNIAFYNKELSYLVCSISLAIILFDGGLNTSMRQFKVGVKPAISLATLGVFLTAFIVALPLYLFVDLDFLPALLIGATVASTDAAAVFMLLHQQKIKLRQRVISTLETESGLNDPMAVLLTIGVAHLIIGDTDGDLLSLSMHFIQHMGIGIMAGWAGGHGMGYIMRHDYIPDGLKHIFGVSGTLTIFGATALLSGSGFMAVYLAGLVLGNNLGREKVELSKFMDSMAWLSQIVMLLILGLLVTPSRMLEDLPLALVASFALIFIARPAAVFSSLYISRFSKQEKLFISWVGLRGAVPIYLALIPYLLGVENSQIYFNVAFAIVVCSLVLQGWTIRPVAKLLGLQRD